MNAAPLYYWIMMREHIRRMKDAGAPRPWSPDPIMHDYRFCNVRREDDRGTIWIRQHIREPFADHPYLWFMLCIARQINWPDTLAELIGTPAWPNDNSDMNGSWSPGAMIEIMNARKARDAKVYTGAYMISAPAAGGDKSPYIARNVLGDLWQHRDIISSLFNFAATIEQVHKHIMQFNGWGPFMAYQACVDMRFTRLLMNASDRYTWAAAGPGTIRGLNRLYGRPFRQALSQRQALEEMQMIYRDVQQLTGVAMDFSDVPNVLCETDKLIRTQLDEGTPRNKYVPGRGY